MVRCDKRWRDREQRWVAPPDVFNPQGYAVDVLDNDRVPKAFINQHHYSGSYPAARLAVGLFRSRGIGPELVGVGVFSVPMQQAVLPKYLGAVPGAELGRFVCLPEVKYNGETWFLARAFQLLTLAKPVRGVLSFADPLERTTEAGLLIKPQHWGTIYQASNALFVGKSGARTLVLAPDGSVVSERALSKIRNEERGWQHATRKLLALGAPARVAGETPAAWVRRALLGFRRVRHPGNLAYVFGLDRSAKAALSALHGTGLKYVKGGPNGL